MVATYGILSIKAENNTEPHTMMVYSKNRLSPPASTMSFAASSISPTSVIPRITTKRPQRTNNVSKSTDAMARLRFVMLLLVT